MNFCLIHQVYYFLWYHDLIPLLILVALIGMMLYNKYGQIPKLTMDPLLSDVYNVEPAFSTVEEKKKYRKKQQETTKKVEKRGVTDWWSDLKNDWGPFMLLQTGDIADLLE